jgi:hypothetical protein
MVIPAMAVPVYHLQLQEVLLVALVAVAEATETAKAVVSVTHQAEVDKERHQTALLVLLALPIRVAGEAVQALRVAVMADRA